MAYLPAVPVERIFLHLSNPRFEEVETEDEAIERLCSEEDVRALAADIVSLNSINPLELLALVPVPKSKNKSSKVAGYIVVEGNRRICALKLLNDPERAPSKYKKAFKELAKKWTDPFDTVAGETFEKYEDAKVWIQRNHSGFAGGVGRKVWSPEQQRRFTGGARNKIAQDMLDYAEEHGFLTAEERKRKLTTVDRFVRNKIFQEAIGYVIQGDEIKITRPRADYDKQLKRFIRDIVAGKDDSGKPFSRYYQPAVDEYSRQLAASTDLSGKRNPPTPINKGGKGKGKEPPPKPNRPKNATSVRVDPDLEQALERLGNKKLQSLYYSIVRLPLKDHAPLVYVGVWSFIETLCNIIGKSEKTSFIAYLSKQKLTSLGLPASETKTSKKRALQNISDLGNSTKHDPIAGAFNGAQLDNDMETLKAILVKLTEEAISKSK
jgi:hypothetical protein